MDDVHIFFLPFMAPGHMIPMADLACVCAARGARSTVVTTPGNLPLIRPVLDLTNSSHDPPLPHPIRLLSIPFPSAESGLPDCFENLLVFPTPDVTPEMAAAIELLQRPFVDLIRQHQPQCVISDVHFPWARDVLGVPRFVFHGTGCFPNAVLGAALISFLSPDSVASRDDESFVAPGLPHNIELTHSRLPDYVVTPTESVKRMGEAHRKTDGMVMNSFYDLEPDYVDLMKRSGGMKAWHVGPVSMYSQDIKRKAVRGGAASVGYDDILSWLDGEKAGSVIYVCFGSLGRFTVAQLREIALGLENSEHPFIWVVRYDGDVGVPPGRARREEEGPGHKRVGAAAGHSEPRLGRGVRDALRVEFAAGGGERGRADDHLAALRGAVRQREAGRRRAEDRDRYRVEQEQQQHGGKNGSGGRGGAEGGGEIDGRRRRGAGEEGEGAGDRREGEEGGGGRRVVLQGGRLSHGASAYVVPRWTDITTSPPHRSKSLRCIYCFYLLT